MSATTTPPPLADCLFCKKPQPLLIGNILADHRYGDGSACPGGSRRPADEPGKDSVRRHAILQHDAVTARIRTRRAEMAGDMAKGWKVADLFEYHGDVLIRLEIVAARWRELADHGDWWLAFDAAIRGCTVDKHGTEPTERATAFERARGNRLWLAEARPELAKESAKLDTAGQNIIDNLLYRM